MPKFTSRLIYGYHIPNDLLIEYIKQNELIRHVDLLRKELLNEQLPIHTSWIQTVKDTLSGEGPLPYTYIQMVIHYLNEYIPKTLKFEHYYEYLAEPTPVMRHSFYLTFYPIRESQIDADILVNLKPPKECVSLLSKFHRMYNELHKVEDDVDINDAYPPDIYSIISITDI